MFEVKFTAFSKRENSTKRPNTWAATLNCKMLAPSSITTPRLEVVGVANITNYTYAYIQQFSRCYFVKEWTNDGVKWIVDLVVDVLASFKLEIGMSRQYVLRAASQYNADIMDKKYLATMATEVHQTPGVSEDVNMWDKTTGCYVVRQVGIISDQNINVDYVILNEANFKQLCYAIQLDQGFFISQGLMDKIISVIWLPLNYSALSYAEYSKVIIPTVISETVTLLFKAIPDNSVLNLYSNITYNNPAWLSADRPWCKVAPFAEYALSYYPFGVIQLDSLAVSQDANHKIACRVSLDVKTGGARLKVTVSKSGSEASVLADVAAQMGAEVPMHAASVNGTAIQTGLTGLAATIVGAATENYALAAGGVSAMLGSTGDIAKGIQSAKGSTGTRVSIDTLPTLIYTYYKPADDNHVEYGYPLCKKMNIINLSGFIMCAEPDIELSCTEAERLKVGAYLTGGFYYE